MFGPTRPKVDMVRPTRRKLFMFRLRLTEKELFDQVRPRKNVLTELNRRVFST